MLWKGSWISNKQPQHANLKKKIPALLGDVGVRIVQRYVLPDLGLV